MTLSINSLSTKGIGLISACAMMVATAPASAQDDREAVQEYVRVLLAGVPGFEENSTPEKTNGQGETAVTETSQLQVSKPAGVVVPPTPPKSAADFMLPNDQSVARAEVSLPAGTPASEIELPDNLRAKAPEPKMEPAAVAETTTEVTEDRSDASQPAPKAPQMTRDQARKEVAKMVADIEGFKNTPAVTESSVPAAKSAGRSPLGSDFGEAIVGGGTSPKGTQVWTKRYVLGPGDQVMMDLFQNPLLDENERSVSLQKPQLTVAPDGTLSFLQAKGVKVAGLTIDEARAEFAKELATFHVNPRVIISPIELASKRYTMLGAVANGGTYPIDRPITLLESIALSGGLPTGRTKRGIEQLADLNASFLIRDGKPVPVDFSALYFDADMTQNILIEPDDYIYIASRVNSEIYVFGAVAKTGAVPSGNRMSVTAAIASAGGFGNKAWKQRVLVVRGRMDNPERIVMNMGSVLKGGSPDQTVQPGDIVYVHTRPWAFAEDIADLAIRAFVGGAATTIYSDSPTLSIGVGQ